jgi:hypothetical protein
MPDEEDEETANASDDSEVDEDMFAVMDGDAGVNMDADDAGVRES